MLEYETILESGESRVVYHASGDRLDLMGELKKMVADFQAEVREELHGYLEFICFRSYLYFAAHEEILTKMLLY